jgi:hypothetical protein
VALHARAAGAWPTTRELWVDGHELKVAVRNALSDKLDAIPAGSDVPAWLADLRTTLERRHWPVAAAPAAAAPAAAAPAAVQAAASDDAAVRAATAAREELAAAAEAHAASLAKLAAHAAAEAQAAARAAAKVRAASAVVRCAACGGARGAENAPFMRLKCEPTSVLCGTCSQGLPVCKKHTGVDEDDGPRLEGPGEPMILCSTASPYKLAGACSGGCVLFACDGCTGLLPPTNVGVCSECILIDRCPNDGCQRYFTHCPSCWPEARDEANLPTPGTAERAEAEYQAQLACGAALAAAGGARQRASREDGYCPTCVENDAERSPDELLSLRDAFRLNYPSRADYAARGEELPDGFTGPGYCYPCVEKIMPADLIHGGRRGRGRQEELREQWSQASKRGRPPAYIGY